MNLQPRIACRSCAFVPAAALTLLFAGLGGCATPNGSHAADASAQAAAPAVVDMPPPPPPPALPAAAPHTLAPAPEADPAAYLRVVHHAAAALAAYTCVFTRQERLGLFSTLQPPEAMRALFRAAPLGVRFDWLGAQPDILAAAYVRGVKNDCVGLLRRSGWFSSAPTLQWLDPKLSVAFGKSRYPITEFGLARMIEQTLHMVNDADRHGGAVLKYIGREQFEGCPSHHIQITYPKAAPYEGRLQRIYVDAATHLPLGVTLLLADGSLDARYTYLNVEPVRQPPPDEAFSIDPAADARAMNVVPQLRQ